MTCILNSQAIAVVSQWPESLNSRIAVRLGAAVQIIATQDCDAVSIGVSQILLVAPGAVFPEWAPPGWPFALKWIQLISSGIDHFPNWLLNADQGVRISTGKGTSALAMAEFVIASIFAHAKRMPQVWIDHPSRWHLISLGTVRGSTLGIAGLGVLGQEAARLALAVGMKVSALRHRHAVSPVAGVDLVTTLDELVAQSDHLLLLLPSTRDTHHIVNAQLLAKAKRDMHLINLGRGSLVDQDALLDALDQGRLSQATLDVTEPEPLPERHPLYHHSRVRLSPHTSVATDDTFDALIDRVVENFRRLGRGERLDGQIGA